MYKRLFKSLKFIAVIGIIVSSINQSYGNNPWDPRIYCGLGLGGAHLSAKNTLSVNGHNFNSKLSDSSIHGELFLGYGMSNNAWHVAVEGHFGLSKLETESLLDITGPNSRHPLNIKSYPPTGGLAFHIGHFITPTHKAYIKLGVELRKFYTSFKGNNILTDHNKDYYSIGFIPGFGIETEINPTMVIRTEYRMALHRAKKFSSSQANCPTTSLKNSPITHTAMIGTYWKL